MNYYSNKKENCDCNFKLYKKRCKKKKKTCAEHEYPGHFSSIGKLKKKKKNKNKL